MNTFLRSSALFALGFGSCVAFAQEAKPVQVKHLGFLDKVQLITQNWWLTTFIATVLLGLLVGFFAYRNAVGNGRAASATGAGCLVAVLVFLAAQVVAIVVLVSTVFAAPHVASDDQTESPEKTQATTTETNTAGTSTAGTTTTGTGTTVPKPSTTGSGTTIPKPGTTTTGDDF